MFLLRSLCNTATSSIVWNPLARTYLNTNYSWPSQSPNFNLHLWTIDRFPEHYSHRGYQPCDERHILANFKASSAKIEASRISNLIKFLTFKFLKNLHSANYPRTHPPGGILWTIGVISLQRTDVLRAWSHKSVLLGHFANDCSLKRTLTIPTFFIIA
jgi:hypothetical protein